MYNRKKIIIIICLISIFHITATSYVFSSSAFEDEISPTFNRYYEYIASKDFQTAYNCRDYQWKSNHSYDWFYNNWSNNKYIELISAEVINVNYTYNANGEINGGEATVKIRIYSEDFETGGTLHKAYYSGKAYCNLAFRGGFGWSIGEIYVDEE